MWTGTCHDVQPHIFVQIYQPEGVKTLRSTTPAQALNEGKKFAKLMKRVFVAQEKVQFGDVAALA